MGELDENKKGGSDENSFQQRSRKQYISIRSSLPFYILNIH